MCGRDNDACARGKVTFVGQEISNRILTIPNLLSLVRLLLLPVFFVLLVRYENNVLSFITLVVASLTDLVDGFIARATNTVTKLGKMLDPMIDRVFILVGVIAIYMVDRIPLWILVVLIGRDASMFVLAIHQRRKYKRDLSVVFLGKLTTTLIMIGFCSLVLHWPVLPGANMVNLSFLPGWGTSSTLLGTWLLYLGVICSLITAGIYFYKGTKPSSDDGLAKALMAQKGSHVLQPSASPSQKERLRYASDSKKSGRNKGS